MCMRKKTKTLAVLLLTAVLCALLVPGALAASGDITQLLRESLQTDVASVTLYTPTEKFSSCGDILYSDETGAMQLALDDQELAALQSISVSTESVYTPREGSESDSEETETWDGETPYVKAGYVLVTLRAEGVDEYRACIAEEYTLSADERAARREAEQAALAAQTAQESEESAEEETTAEATDDPQTAASALVTPVPLPTAQPQTEKLSIFDRIGALSNGAIALVIVGLVLLVAALCELVLLVVYKRRAENVAKNYLRAKAALDANKREMAAARTKALRLERELLQEREKMAAVREELEKLKGVRSKKKADPAPESEAPERKKKTGYDLDYLNWTM